MNQGLQRLAKQGGALGDAGVLLRFADQIVVEGNGSAHYAPILSPSGSKVRGPYGGNRRKAGDFSPAFLEEYGLVLRYP
jgi:hypothetical protein